MNRVLDRLYIGDTRDLDGTIPLRSLGFVAVLDLRDYTRGADLDVDGLFHLTNRDGDPWAPAEIEQALEFISNHIRKGRVLIACIAGMSRSASMIIGYLVRCGWSVTDAFEAVHQARPQILPLPKMLDAALAVALHGPGRIRVIGDCK